LRNVEIGLIWNTTVWLCGCIDRVSSLEIPVACDVPVLGEGESKKR